MIEHFLLEVFKPELSFNQRTDLTMESFCHQAENIIELTEEELAIKPGTYFSALYIALSEGVYAAVSQKIRTNDNATASSSKSANKTSTAKKDKSDLAFCTDLLRMYLFVFATETSAARKSKCLKEYIHYAFTLVEGKHSKRRTASLMKEAINLIEQ